MDRLAALVGAGTTLRRSVSERIAHAPDASHFLLTPAAVTAPRDSEAVGRLMAAAAQAGVPLTFRSGGTSLSGQAVTAGVLADVRRHFRAIEVLDEGRRVRVQGGATLRAVNARLAPFLRKLGPDPASEIACTIGGVLSNNSSGMACGTVDNAYRTLDSVVVVLPSGTVVDTGAADADEQLRLREPALHEGLDRLRDRVRGDAASVRTVERLFALKNTMGYGLNSFLDHTRPVDILARLIVGSEGTLAFIASATFRTVPLRAHAVTGLLPFRDLPSAMAAVSELLPHGPATVELLDSTALRVARRDPASAAVLPGADPSGRSAMLLVEYQEESMDSLIATEARVARAHAELGLGDAPLSRNAAHRSALWRLRKGLYATVAAARPPGSSALLEDVVVPLDRLAATCSGLTDLFERHGYSDSVIFGHAKDGNVHFMLTDRFDDPTRLRAYSDFTSDMVDLVLEAGGSLKAEHGTGRTMAPFVARQYGDELYDVMREIKRLFDPRGVLNPGVILNDDPHAHLQQLKTTPQIEPEADRCVECGYCEPVCPSKDLTTTPRQRIVLRRARAAALAAGDMDLVDQLDADARYDVVDTCAVDGMCQTACPVLINTGDLVKHLRSDRQGRITEAAGRSAARHWTGVTRGASWGLDAAKALPSSVPTGLTRAARRVMQTRVVPQWSDDLPGGGPPRASTGTPSDAQAVLFSSCLGSMFGGEPGASAAFRALCNRAGISIATPQGIDGLCCGTPWSSKGLEDGHAIIRARVTNESRRWQASPQRPIVCDAASCTEGLRTLLTGTPEGSLIVDAVEFTLTTLLPRLTVTRKLGSVVVHPTCSTTRANGVRALLDLVAVVADEVVVPPDWGCCGFAGDRGMLVPELTATATAREAAGVATREYDAYVSDNRACEMGMTRATGHRYVHVLELVEEFTRPADVTTRIAR